MEHRVAHSGGPALLEPAPSDADVAARFADAVARTRPALSALARRMVGNEEDAAEIVQESYLRAWRGLPRFRGEARLTTWLHQIALNTARSFIRRRGRQPGMQPIEDWMAETAESHPSVDPQRWCEVRASCDDLADAIAELPPSLGPVVVLKDLHGLSHDAVASELGISREAAKVRLHRARRRLQQHLSPRPDELRPTT